MDEYLKKIIPGITEREIKYLKLFYEKGFQIWENICREDGIDTVEKFKKESKIKTIDEYLSKKHEAECGRERKKEFKNIYDLFKNKEEANKKLKEKADKEAGEGSTKEIKTWDRTEFFKWYIEYGIKKKCYYCGIDEESSKKMFEQGIFKSKHPAWQNGSLQIDRANPDDGYNYDNSRVACLFCNNAKSDLITREDFKKYFGHAMKRYLDAQKLKLK